MDDRAIVAALVAGDQRGLEGAYRTYADRLFTYCRGLLRDPEAAADAVHDTFVIASQRADQLREPDRLRPWLYAIARNECLRMLRSRARQVPLAEVAEMSAPEVDPSAGVRAAEVQELVWAAAEGLNPGDREVFELAVRHELPAPEVSTLLGVPPAHAHARLSRARAQLERALGALLVARTGTEDCPQLAELMRGWDGRLTALVRKRVGRHIESCDTCTERQRRQLRPAALFSAYAAAPWLAAPVELWPRLERTSFAPGSAQAREAVVRRAGRLDAETGFPRPSDVLRRRRVTVAAAGAVAAAVALLAGAGALFPLWGPDDPDPLPTAAALASPVTSPPHPQPSPTAAAGPPPPPTSAPPAAPPSHSPPPSSATTRPPGPLVLEAEAAVVCARGYHLLEVSASAGQPLDRALLTVRDGAAGPVDYPMEVTRASATGRAGPVDGPELRWWVMVVAADGRTAETEPVTEVVYPCVD